jgi:hypothetical protein
MNACSTPAIAKLPHRGQPRPPNVRVTLLPGRQHENYFFPFFTDYPYVLTYLNCHSDNFHEPSPPVGDICQDCYWVLATRYDVVARQYKQPTMMMLRGTDGTLGVIPVRSVRSAYSESFSIILEAWTSAWSELAYPQAPYYLHGRRERVLGSNDVG